MAKKGNVTRVLISIIFIALGLGFAVDAVVNIFDGNLSALLGIDCVLGVLMFILGIMGVSGSPLKACRVIAAFVCLLAITSFVLTVFTFSIPAIIGAITTKFVWALLSWIYFDLT